VAMGMAVDSLWVSDLSPTLDMKRP
jgi:hypothetical protein